MQNKIISLLAYIIFSVTFTGCGSSPLPGLDAPDQFILYSIEERPPTPGEEPKPEEKFYSYYILGKTEITDIAKRRELADALKAAVTKSDGTKAECFWPHHAIRAVKGGKTIDYVICFKCLQMATHDGDSSSMKTITADPQSLFNKHLKDAGVPLSQQMDDDKK
jgi:hypothetical protein